MGYMKWLDRMGQMAEISAINSTNDRLADIKKEMVRQRERAEMDRLDMELDTDIPQSPPIPLSGGAVAGIATVPEKVVPPIRAQRTGGDQTDIKERLAKLEEKVKGLADQAFARMNLITRDDLSKLEQRLARIEKRLAAGKSGG